VRSNFLDARRYTKRRGKEKPERGRERPRKSRSLRENKAWSHREVMTGEEEGEAEVHGMN